MNKRKLVSLVIACVAFAATLSLPIEVRAGARYDESIVRVNQAERHFGGSFGSARNSANNIEWLYCDVVATRTGKSGRCGARDANDNQALCSTNNTSMLDVILSMNSDDLIYVEFNSSGQCTTIKKSIESTEPPRAH